VATTADDQTLRVWDPAKHALVSKVAIAGASRVCAFSPDGSMLAVGTEDGRVLVHSYPALKTINVLGGRKRQISEIKFSPDGKMLAVGTHESQADVYEVPSFRKIGSLIGHSSWIAHLDWSKDSAVIRTNCGAYELLYWDARSCKQLTNPAPFKDTEWDTESCTITWGVQGIWPPFSDGSDINAIAVNKARSLLALGNDFRQVVIANYPCLEQKQPKSSYTGHSEHVTNVCFTLNDTMVVSAGGLDASVLMWRVVPL
jgi:WD40 repeat protein